MLNLGNSFDAGDMKVVQVLVHEVQGMQNRVLHLRLRLDELGSCGVGRRLGVRLVMGWMVRMLGQVDVSAMVIC